MAMKELTIFKTKGGYISGHRTPIMEDQMEQTSGHEMEARVILGLCWSNFGVTLG